MSENQTIFINCLDDYCSKYFKLHPNNQNIDQNTKMRAIHENIYLKSKISELLMFNDKISLKVHGENLPLMLLISWFGVDGVLELFKQEALEFVLWTNMITHTNKDIEGVHPLQTGYYTSDIYKKPTKSAEEGFKWINGKERPSKRTRKKLARHVRKNSIITPNEIFENDLNIIKFYYKEYIRSKRKLTIPEKTQLTRIADDRTVISIAGKNKYSFWNADNTFKVLNKQFNYYSENNLILEKISKIFEIEKLTNISKLIETNKIPSTDIPQLRIDDETIKFREWIKSKSSKSDYLTVAQEYNDALKSKYNFTGSNWFKNLRIASFSVLGGIIGTLIGDPVNLGTLGFIVGGSASGILSSTFDQYLLEGLITGWKPQNFIEQSIRPYTASNTPSNKIPTTLPLLRKPSHLPEAIITFSRI